MNNTIHTTKKTKIVATIGPATEDEATMTALVQAGMNVARLNFSHQTHDIHLARLHTARTVSRTLGVPLTVLQDLAGPKIRIGDIQPETIELVTGDTITITTQDCVGSKERLCVNYPTLHQELKSGSVVFIRDGRIKLDVLSISGHDLLCKIIVGGEIKGRKGVNLPGAYLKISALTDKDRKDVQWGVDNDVDFMALSFVRNANDVHELRELIRASGKDIKIMSKIETQEAIDNIDEIVQASDAIMIARGDLAIEVPAEHVPVLQKQIIRKCNKLGKPVVVATQMLESMISSPVPTRAEVNDVANAILDGADAIMLSEETTLGKHPEKAVEVMQKVALHTEEHFPYEEILRRHHLAFKDVTDSVGYAVVNTAHELNASAIIALTMSGYTARMISRYKPKRPVLVITPDVKTYNRMALKWNCYPMMTEKLNGLNETIERAKRLACDHGFAKQGETVVIAAGVPFGTAGNTNMMMVQKA